MKPFADFLCAEDRRTGTHPLLTLVLCSYKQAPFVHDAVAAAKRVQELVDAELLFIDDGSQDESFTAAREALSASSNYLALSKANRGLVHSLNLGLELARGQYIIFIAADDKLCPAGVQQALRRLQECPSARFFLGNATYFGDRVRPRAVYGKRHAHYLRMPAGSRPVVTPSTLPAPLLLQATVFEKVYLRKMNGWDADVMLDDLAMFLRMFKEAPQAGQDFLYDLDLVLADYRLHPGGNSRRLENQYMMIEQCVSRYCPPELYPHEISAALATYTLNAIRQADRATLRFMLATAFTQKVVMRTVFALVGRAAAKGKQVLMRAA